MEVSVMGSSHMVVKVVGNGSGLNYRELGICGFRKSEAFTAKRRVFVRRSKGWRSSGARLSLQAKLTDPVRPQKAKASCNDLGSSSPSSRRSRPVDGVRLYVGLPLDTVSECHTVNYARAITAGLRALKLMGVDGVELPVWWGVVEKDSMGEYEWSGYLAVAELVQKMGLKLHVSFCFHGCRETKIPLPDWVCRIGDQDHHHAALFFTDRSGKQCKDCLSLAVDDLPVLNGKTPIQVYKDFCESFKSTFAPFMGSTIMGITMGLGPDGELRYPSNHLATKKRKNAPPGVGEFQCYDQNMLKNLKQHAEAAGNPLWGLGGPHDAPSYDQPPTVNSFFKDQGGSWETPYGVFFLSWYSSQLISHGDRLLSLVSSVFSDTPVAISGRVPIHDNHSWYKTRSHPCELTAGFYNTENRDGYEAVAAMFAKNSCRMILPGMDLLDEHQPPNGSGSSPQSLLAQIKAACRKHGVDISGQNAASASTAVLLPGGFEQIKRNLMEDEESMVDLFTYQRMGASFFSPEHFPLFTEFVRGLISSQPDQLLQQPPHDMLEVEEEEEESLPASSEAEKDLHVRVPVVA
ncbi:beta-amylase [Dionaea muscipula]